MRKFYMFSILTTLFSLLSLAMPLQAEEAEEEVRAYVGIQNTPEKTNWTNIHGTNFVMVGLDVNTFGPSNYPSEEDEVFTSTQSMSQIAGCLADEVYYSVMQDEDGTMTLHSLNCATNKDITIATIDSDDDIKDMTYEATSGKVYTLQNNESSTSTLCELNTATGELTTVKSGISNVYFAIAAKDGKLYMARQYMPDDEYYYHLFIDEYNTDGKLTTEGEEFDKKIGYGTQYDTNNCMEFYNGKLYLITKLKLYIADLDNKTLTYPTYTNFQGTQAQSTAPASMQFTGICFAKSTKDPSEEKENTGTDFYMGLYGTGTTWNDGNGKNFCIAGFNTANLSEVGTSTYFTVTDVPFKGESEIKEIAGCLADNIYYAAMYDEDADSYTLHTLNCTTGNDVEIGSFQQVYDMAYDNQSKKLYALQSYYTNSSNGYGLYEVNTSNGKLTEVALFEDVTYFGMTIKDGIAYFASEATNFTTFKTTLSLTTFNLTSKETDALTYANVGNVGYTGESNSIEFNGDLLYIVLNRTIYTFDFTTKALTKLDGSLPKSMSGICFALSSEDGEANNNGGDILDPLPEDTRLVSVVEFYGSSMGDWDGLARKEVTFYDKNNNPLRKATYGAIIDYDTKEIDSLEIERYSVNEYDEAGEHLLTSFSQQYGEGRDGADKGFAEARDSVTYEYNKEGLLSKKTDNSAYKYYTYEYSDGLLTTETTYVIGSTTPMQTITYSNFTEKGEPQSIKAEGQYTYQKYEETIEYNSRGQKTSRVRYGYSDVWNEETNDFDQVASLSESEVWTYNNEDGMLLTDSVSKSGYDEWGSPTGILVPSSKTTYAYDGDNTNRIVCRTYSVNEEATSDEDLWVESLQYSITEKKEYAPSLATELTVENVSDEINTQKLSFTVPNDALIGGYVFDIYRHGIKVGRVQMSDEGAYDETIGKLTYTDAGVKNGTYDYFVQTVMLDELEEVENALNISNVVKYTANVELPAPTNVHATAVTTIDNTKVVTITWNAPENVSKYDFQRYNVIYENYKVADNAEADGQATTWDTEYNEIVPTLYVQAVYKYGKADSELYTIPAELVCIDNATLSDGSQIIFDGTNLSLTSPANITVFTTNGTTMVRANEATSLSLSNLPKGAYVITVQLNGKLHVMKVVR